MDDTVICPACATMIGVGLSCRSHRSAFNAEVYKLYHCKACGMEFWSPLKIVTALYEREGFDAYESYHAGTRPFPRWTLPFLEHLPARNGALLDIGCGDGAFLHRAVQTGFTAHGIDLDPKSIAVARTRYGLRDVEACTLAEHAARCQHTGVRYQVITFFEVLEHQDNLTGFLRQVQALLATSGYLAGSVPNRDRFLGNLERWFGNGDFPPHHFLWFSDRVLYSLLARHGFTDITVVPTGQIGVREIISRLLGVAERFGRRWQPLPRCLLKVAITVGAIPAALLLYMGLRARPTHLYFQARWSG